MNKQEMLHKRSLCSMDAHRMCCRGRTRIGGACFAREGTLATLLKSLCTAFCCSVRTLHNQRNATTCPGTTALTR